ncbi:MAG: DnaB-like helicase C-terminal domain-containing protein [Armatimonadia bacterium]
MRNIDPIKAEEDFRAALRDAGLVPPDGITADGKLHRIDVEDEKPGRKSGFYVFHCDGIPAGAYGDWHDGQDAWKTWCACQRDELTQEEYLEHKKRLDTARAARTEADKARKQEAKERAARIWEQAKPCESHPYLDRKGVGANGAREANGRIVIPLRDAEGEISSVEFIDAEGNKLFLAGGKKAGCWFALGEPLGALCVAEGFATGASIHESTGLFVAVAFDCGNLAAVAKSLRAKYPTAKIVICADDDPKEDGKNPGVEAAEKAAAAANALIAVPDMPQGGDFNDQAAIKGADSVRETIQEALDGDDGPIIAADLFPLVVREIQARKAGKSKTALHFGIPSVDKLTGGLRSGMMTIIAGLPGAGKTAAAIGTILHNVVHGVPCLLFSIEMDRVDIGVRFVSIETGIPAFDMLDQYRPIGQDAWARIHSADARLQKAPLTVDDRPVSLADIEATTHKWYATEVRAKGHSMGLVVVDYLGLIRSGDDSESRNREVAMMCQRFKQIVKSRSIRVAGLLLAQLNRLAARREGEPELSDLRDSGEVEAAGDLILFPYPWPRLQDNNGDPYMKPAPDGVQAVDKWLCKKNKNGPTGAAAVLWKPEIMHYTGLTNMPEPARDARGDGNWHEREER